MKRNGIILAAGFSSRFVPLSWEKPKALLDVKGQILIERQIIQLKEAGIDEIVVVTGYKAELFSYLEEKFKVTLVHNPYYEVRNNHSSLYVAREYLKDSYICCADNYYASDLFVEAPVHSYYSSAYVKGKTDEWCISRDSDGLITGVSVGGQDSWIMIGPAYFDRKFSETYVPLLEKTMEDESCKDWYWEDIYIKNMKELPMYVREFDDSFIEEFDSLEDLRKFDSRYIDDTGSSIMEDLARKYGCSQGDIVITKPVKSENRVIGFDYKIRGKSYSYMI